MTLLVKDANTTTISLATQLDSSGNLVRVHLSAMLTNGVAQPVTQAVPMPARTVGSTASDGSGTIVTGGVAQNLFDGSIPVNGYLVSNLNPTGGRTLYISDVGAASTTGSSIPIPPQTYFTSPPGYKPPQAVSIFGTTTADPFAARVLLTMTGAVDVFDELPATGLGDVFSLVPVLTGTSHVVSLVDTQTLTYWASPTPGHKTTSIPAAAPANAGYILVIKTTLGNGDLHTVTPASGTIDGAGSLSFTDNSNAYSLISDGVSNWLIGL